MIDKNHNLYSKYYSSQPDKLRFTQFANYSSKKLKWMDTDSESLWLSTVDSAAKGLYKDGFNGWVDYYTKNPIVYNMNSNGFRDEELSKKPKCVDVFLGCSFTSGVGLPYDKIWPSIVKKHTNFPSINAGIGGTGPVTQLRVLMWLLKHFEIRNVFHLVPLSSARYEWFNPQINNYTMWMAGKAREYNPVNDILSEDRNIGLSNFAFISAIKSACYDNGVNYFLEYDIFHLIHNIKADAGSTEFYLESHARDIGHSGFHPHRVLAKKFIKKLNIKELLI